MTGGTLPHFSDPNDVLGRGIVSNDIAQTSRHVDSTVLQCRDQLVTHAGSGFQPYDQSKRVASILSTRESGSQGSHADEPEKLPPIHNCLKLLSFLHPLMDHISPEQRLRSIADTQS